MPLGTLQSFADNLRPGLDSLGEMIAQMQARKNADATVNNAMAGRGGDPKSAAPTGFPPQVAAGLAALAGGDPKSASPTGFPPYVPTGPVPAGASFAQAFNPQGQGASAPAGAAQQKPAQAQPNPNLSSTAQPGAAGMDDPAEAGRQSLGYLIRSMKATNPGISNTTLMAAVRQQIDDIKGLAPLTKAAMTAQVAVLNLQVKQQALNQRWLIDRQNADSREERNQIDEKHFTAMEALAGGRIDASERNTDARDATTIKATGMRDKAMQDRANTAATAALDREIARAKGTERNALIAAKAKVAAALLGSFKSGDQSGVGDEADSIMGDGSPAGGGQDPAPAGGQDFAAQGGKKASDGHWYAPNTGPDKKTHPYLRLD